MSVPPHQLDGSLKKFMQIAPHVVSTNSSPRDAQQNKNIWRSIKISSDRHRRGDGVTRSSKLRDSKRRSLNFQN
jgi:hypothetical protein